MPGRLIRELWTDGACHVSTGEGGWAYVLVARKDFSEDPGKHRYREVKRVERSGHESDTTNNAMELWAVIEGLGALNSLILPPNWITVYSDAKYVVGAYNQGWINLWRKHNWHTRDGRGRLRPIANPELWKVLDRLASTHNIEWRHIKGHAGSRLNERADQLAVAASNGECV